MGTSLVMGMVCVMVRGRSKERSATREREAAKIILAIYAKLKRLVEMDANALALRKHILERECLGCQYHPDAPSPRLHTCGIDNDSYWQTPECKDYEAGID